MKTYFFILSFSRSGSTVLGQKLNNHSKVTVFNESWIFNFLAILNWKKLTPNRQHFLIHTLNKNINSHKQKIKHEIVTENNISSKEFFTRIVNTNNSFIGEKTPTNIFYYNFIRRRIRNAKFLFLKRHPLAIASSYFIRWYSRTYNDLFLINVVSTIKAYYRNFDRIADKSEILQISYEDLVKDSKYSLEKIACHIGFEFEDKMLAESETELFENNSDKKHHKDSAKKLNTDHLQKYRETFNKQQISELCYLLRFEIESMDYNFDEKPIVNERLLILEEKIQSKISYKNVRKRKRKQKFKLYLSYYKYNLFKYLKVPFTQTKQLP